MSVELHNPIRAGVLALALLAGGEVHGSETGTGLELSGEAFGTTWKVRVPAAHAAAAQPLAPKLAAILAGVDARMSTWREDSELSRFNARRSSDWFPVSAETAAVVTLALEVHRRSGGAFDPSVAPLVELWGFGRGPLRLRPPDAAELSAVRARVDVEALEVRADPPALRKSRPDLSLDLSGVAKGFAVDVLAEQLRSAGVTCFLVEVGGELRAGPAGRAWRVGIERPEPGAAGLAWTLELLDTAVASSGDYRRFFEWEGRRLSHLIDPRSGRPVAHELASVSVIAPSAARADAWATALRVLGPEEGPRLAEREGLVALFAGLRDGMLETRTTGAFPGRRTD